MSVSLQTLSAASGGSRPLAVSQTLPLIARLQTRTDLLIKSIELFSYHLHLFPHGVPTKCVTSWGERRHWALSTRQASSVRLNCRTRGQRCTMPKQLSIASVSCLLGLNLRTHQVPNVLIQGFVLGLIAEVHLILCHCSWVSHTHHSSLTDLCKFHAPVKFFLRYRRSAVAMNGGVLAVGALAIVVASAVLLRDFTRDVMNRVFKNNCCHS